MEFENFESYRFVIVSFFGHMKTPLQKSRDFRFLIWGHQWTEFSILHSQTWRSLQQRVRVRAAAPTDKISARSADETETKNMRMNRKYNEKLEMSTQEPHEYETLRDPRPAETTSQKHDHQATALTWHRR